MKIYVASSWRNEYQPEVVRLLRQDKHEVYDFRGPGDGWGGGGNGPGGFSWSEIDPSWKNWTDGTDVLKYLDALDHERAVQGFRRDMDALIWSDVVVFVMPCGPSASMEMGWGVGSGRLVIAYIPAIREPDLMVKMAHHITDDLYNVREILHQFKGFCKQPQGKIADWYTRNGGFEDALNAARRTKLELHECLDALLDRDFEHAKEEVADVAICTFRLADELGMDLLQEIDRKHQINEGRKWTVSETGALFHVKE